MLISKPRIEEAMDAGDISIEPCEAGNLEGASYDVRLGEEGIVTQQVDLNELKGKVETGSANKIDIRNARQVTIPAGGLALVTTHEKFSLSNRFVGHIGMKSYYVRKGIGLLSGLQIDPGFGNPPASLVLAIKNQSTRSITIDYKDDICSVEFHRLNEPAPEYDNPSIEKAQRSGGIPKEDVDYLRTIEAMSISEMTEALLSLSRSVESTNTLIKRAVIPLVVGLLVTLIIALIIAVL